ncbi:MAG TPA: GAF domain-containing protein, partial [Anaerolineae bacterium]
MSGECILVIDDSKEIVKHLTEHVLPSFGYKTLHAYDGQSGLKLIREEKPNLVMLDFNLPEMTGLDVLQKLAQESMNTPVVLMTGYGSELSAIEAFRLGAKDYLIKPFTVEEIIETIDRALVETRLLHDKQELAEQLRRVKVEMSRQTSEMKTLSNIGKAITSLLSVDQVLERVLEAATYLTNAEESTIWLPNASGTKLRAYEKKGDSQEEVPWPELSVSDSQVGQVMKTGRPLRDSVFTGKGIKVKTGYFARAVLYVPLKLRGVTMGVLGVSNRTALRSFSKRDEFLLSFLADYAAIALENARVFQAADQALASRLEELHTLIEITRTITSSLNLDEVIRLTIQQVHDSWKIEASSLWLLDEAKQSLKVLANIGTPADQLTQVEVPLGEGFVGEVAKTGKWLYTNDAASHPLHYRQADSQTGFKTRSLLCVPIMFRGKVVGSLELLNKRDGDFDDQDVERALSIAAAVAIAVTNALLFKESEAHKQALRELDKAKDRFLETISQDMRAP